MWRGDPRLIGILQSHDAIHTLLLQHNKIWITKWADGGISGCKYHVNGEEGGVALTIIPFTKNNTRPESSRIWGVKKKKAVPCRAGGSGLMPPCLRRLRIKTRFTQRSSSHYADSKPWMQWPAHEDAITTVRWNARFVLVVVVGISCWPHGCITGIKPAQGERCEEDKGADGAKRNHSFKYSLLLLLHELIFYLTAATFKYSCQDATA